MYGALYEGPYLLPKRVLHKVRSSASSFNFQYPPFPQSHLVAVLTSSSSPSPHFYPSFYLSFNNAFQKTVPTQDVTKPVSLFFSWLNAEYSCLRLSVMLHFSHNPSIRSSLSFSSTKFQNFLGISDLLSKCPCFKTMQSYSSNVGLYYFLP